MECNICMEYIIDDNKIIKLICNHKLCSSCYDKLVRNLCPYCRTILDDKIDGTYNIEYDINEIELDNDIELYNIIPISELVYNENIYNTNHLQKFKKNIKYKKEINFISNKEKEPFERRKKKWKKTKKYELKNI